MLSGCAVLAAAAPVAADATNRNFLPFGERAAMLANAGITSANSEAVYYNPANLARIGHSELSVSGSTFLRFELATDAAISLQGVDQPFDASGFVIIPSTIVSTYDLGSWTLATAVLVPDTFELSNRVTFQSPDLRITQLVDQRRQSLWLGAGLARSLGPDLSIGVSAFVSNETEAETSFVRVESGDPATVLAEQLTRSDITVRNLSAIVGVMWQPSPALGIGVRIHTATVKLTGSGEIYQSAVQVGTDMDMFAERVIEDIDVARPLPWDLGLGISYRPLPTLSLLVDASVQLPASLTTMDDAVAGKTRLELDLAPRVGIGAEWELATSRWLRLGLMYNRSALPAADEPGEPAPEHYAGATAGFAWQKKRTTTSFGLFYMMASPRFIVEGTDPPRATEARARLYGALFAVSYSL